MDKRGAQDKDSGGGGDVEGLKRSVPPRPCLTRFEQRLLEADNLDSWKPSAFAGNLIDDVTDEICLEGLDGITIQALKVRLEARPNLELEGFEDVAPALWNQIKLCKHFRFYILPKARPDLVPYRWDMYRDERGSIYEPLHAPEEIYTYNPIEDKQHGIRGSCQYYHSRKDVSDIIRRIGYVDALKLLGNRLVIVASQSLRERALLGVNYRKFERVQIIQYCIMERVGRARSAGEITRGKVSLNCMKIPPKTLFYIRKLLLTDGLIVRQATAIKYANCRCPAIITVFHLPRFYHRIESVSSLNTRVIFSCLNQSETKSLPVEAVVSKYGKHTLRNILNQFPTLLETMWDRRENSTAPNTAKEEIPVFTVDDLEPIPKKPEKKFRAVRVLRLKVTDVSQQNQILRRVLDCATGSDESDKDNISVSDAGGGDGDGDEATTFSAASGNFSNITILRTPHCYTSTTDTWMLHHALLRAGTNGLTLSEMSFLPLTNLERRSASRILTRHGACKEGMLKMYKQKAYTYTLTKYSSDTPGLKPLLNEKCFLAQEELHDLRQRMAARKAEKMRKKYGASRAVTTTNEDNPSSDPLEVTSASVDLPGNGDPEPSTSSPKKFLARKKKAASKSKTSQNQGISIRAQSIHPDPLHEREIENALTPLTLTPPEVEIRMPTLCLAEKVIKTDGQEEDDPPKLTQSEMTTQPLDEILGMRGDDMGDDEDDDEILEDYCDEEGQKSKKGDSIDDAIRRKMTRQRVDWNATDDRYILMAFIASVLFVPKYNFAKLFIYNAFQIRDLMLKRNESRNPKTSLAIRRRLHFLANQRPFFETYIGLMGAAVRDETLYESLVKKHLKPPQQKIYICPPDSALEEVIQYLYRKFDGVAGEYQAPDTRVTMNGIETLLFVRQLKRTEFYWKAMMFTIFCPMGDSAASRRRFRNLWRRNVETPQETETDDKEEEISSENDDEYLEFCFKFLRFLTKHCKIIFNNLLMLGSASNSSGFELISFDINVASSNICFSVRECSSVGEVRLWAARSLVLSLIFSGDPSKTVEKSVTDLINLPMERAAKSLMRARVLVSSKKTGCLGISRHNMKQFASGLPSNSFDETLDFLEYIDEASHVDSLACISIGILFGIVELTDYFKSSISMTESIFTLNDEWAPVYDGIADYSDMGSTKSKKRKGGQVQGSSSELESPALKKMKLTEKEEEEIEGIYECLEKMEMDSRKTKGSSSKKKNVGLEEGEDYNSSSSNALRLLRIRLNEAGVHMPGKQFTGFVEKDFFTVNLPNLEFVFPRRSGLNHRIAGCSHPYDKKDNSIKELLRAELVDLVYHNVSDVNGVTAKVANVEKFLGKFQILFEIIDCAGSVGLSGAFLMSKFENKSLLKGLRYLLEARLIFCLGVAERRFVSYKNVKEWTIPIRPKGGSMSVGRVIMRPWITTLGSLSWSAVNRFLISLLGQLHRPSVLLDEFVEGFSPTLSPVEVMILVNVLVKLKYLIVYRLKESSPATLFSKHSGTSAAIEYNVDTLLESEDVFVAVSPYATFLQAQLQSFLSSSRNSAETDKPSKKKDSSTVKERFSARRKAASAAII